MQRKARKRTGKQETHHIVPTSSPSGAIRPVSASHANDFRSRNP
jgi:hypothetical protein